ncbi:lysophospholipid acyltransferase family protein [Aquibacillus salsiterrae]|uniref:1-acyl-sn-glycerol-3-phosphate acyltransferase n=1 Tax=Aquibacillus salsiterrae TaxID=2950439 RepID=A0A9X3WB92_9BACI|nr:lysophospholipid acyltransferase family protein [Aquibacillus salsiterrae]MDC3415393.1 1-acyl-sn-glycerol-3-phosphate acyltransferase [Aquibacillus salsiterrae]
MSLYKIGKALCTILLSPIYRVKVIGENNVPKSGPVIICSNHISNLDPPIVGITCPRDIYFMAKEELFSNKLVGGILRGVHAFPIKRGMKDRNALRQALAILKDGNTLGLFPEGTRSKTGEIGEGLSGAGFFALRSEAVIIPCAIVGPYRKFGQLKVVYGKPIEMDELRERKASAQEVTDIIMHEIKKLLENHK